MTTHDRRTPEDIIWSTLRADRPYPDGTLTEADQAVLSQRTDRIMRALTQAGFTIKDALNPAGKTYSRDEVETAWNAGAELVLQDGDLQLSDRDTDLVNLVCNAIGTCLDQPETDDLTTVILANYDPDDASNDYNRSREMSDETRADIVRGWINQ